jgi:hypothetical protein
MKILDFLKRIELQGLKINAAFASATITFKNSDKAAAWEIYIDLVTRIATQPLKADEGVDKAALDSLHDFFKATRETIKRHGPSSYNAARISVVVLNGVLRPFLAKWHLRTSKGPLSAADHDLFRAELQQIQRQLRGYLSSLAELIGVEDISQLWG